MLDTFLEKFKELDGKNGFYDFIPYNQGVGFSIKKNLEGGDENFTSLLSFYIPNKPDELPNKKLVIADVTYGRKRPDGVYLRRENEFRIFDPLDLTSRDEYYYNEEKDQIFDNMGKIYDGTLLFKIYDEHIKVTQPIRGLWLRTKIYFFRVIAKNILGFIYHISRCFLYIISGDIYSYDPVFQEEVLNNIIIDHSWTELIGKPKNRQAPEDRQVKEMKPSEKLQEPFYFFGYRTTYWAIRAYSLIVIFMYALFEYNNWRPLMFAGIFRNNLLILCFAILSLWVVEGISPFILKKLIKLFSTASTKSSNKKIKI